MSWSCGTKANEVSGEEYFSVSKEAEWLSLGSGFSGTVKIQVFVKIVWYFSNFLNFQDHYAELLEVSNCIVM